MLVPASANVISAKTSPAAYALLKLIRKYVELDQYLGFEVQTMATLDAWSLALSEFETLLHVCFFN